MRKYTILGILVVLVLSLIYATVAHAQPQCGIGEIRENYVYGEGENRVVYSCQIPSTKDGEECVLVVGDNSLVVRLRWRARSIYRCNQEAANPEGIIRWEGYVLDGDLPRQYNDIEFAGKCDCTFGEDTLPDPDPPVNPPPIVQPAQPVGSVVTPPAPSGRTQSKYIYYDIRAEGEDTIDGQGQYSLFAGSEKAVTLADVLNVDLIGVAVYDINGNGLGAGDSGMCAAIQRNMDDTPRIRLEFPGDNFVTWDITGVVQRPAEGVDPERTRRCNVSVKKYWKYPENDYDAAQALSDGDVTIRFYPALRVE